MHREATDRDLPWLRAIQQRSLDEPWDDLLEPAVDGPPTTLVTTAEGADEPVGYAVAIPEGTNCYLAEFAIAPQFRREGRGSALMRTLIERLGAEEYERLRLSVRVDDDRARGFYDAHGFEARSLVPDQYESGDALVLERPL